MYAADWRTVGEGIVVHVCVEGDKNAHSHLVLRLTGSVHCLREARRAVRGVPPGPHPAEPLPHLPASGTDSAKGARCALRLR